MPSKTFETDADVVSGKLLNCATLKRLYLMHHEKFYSILRISESDRKLSFNKIYISQKEDEVRLKNFLRKWIDNAQHDGIPEMAVVRKHKQNNDSYFNRWLDTLHNALHRNAWEQVGEYKYSEISRFIKSKYTALKKPDLDKSDIKLSY